MRCCVVCVYVGGAKTTAPGYLFISLFFFYFYFAHTHTQSQVRFYYLLFIIDKFYKRHTENVAAGAILIVANILSLSVCERKKRQFTQRVYSV